MRAKGTRGTGHPLGGHCLPPSCPAVHALAASRPPSHTHTHSPLPTLTCPLDHPSPPPPTHQPTRWIADNLEVGRPAEVNLFETTIRVLGGLLSAHALSRGSHPALAQRLAEKAADLGARLLPAFASPSGGQGRCKGGGGGVGGGRQECGGSRLVSGSSEWLVCWQRAAGIGPDVPHRTCMPPCRHLLAYATLHPYRPLTSCRPSLLGREPALGAGLDACLGPGQQPV